MFETKPQGNILLPLNIYFCILKEGPHCLIPEDEFYDAVDATLDKLEKEEEKVCRTCAIKIFISTLVLVHFVQYFEYTYT